MANLNFLQNLDADQLQHAADIGMKAKSMGIDPALAISIAYQESRLRPNAPMGADGERGMFQVLPTTGKKHGYSIADLNDPEKNKEAGLKVLKSALDATKGDPRLAVIAYNKGEDHPFFSGGELPKVTEQYLKDLKSYGTFDHTPVAEAKSETASEHTKSAHELSDAPPPLPPDESGQNKVQQGTAGLIGGAIGLGRSVAGIPGEMIESVSQRVAAGKLAAQQAAEAAKATELAKTVTPTPTPTPIPTGGLPTTQPTIEPTMEPTAESTRILQGGNSDTLGTTGRARQEGYNTDTAQKAAIKAEMEKITPQARQVLANMPGMTSTPSGILIPRTEARPTAGPRPNPAPLSTPVAPAMAPDIGSITPSEPRMGTAPLNIPKSTAVPSPSTLDELTSMFQKVAQPVVKATKAVAAPILAGAEYGLRKLSPPLAMYEAGKEGMNLYQQSQLPPEKRQDTTSMALSGLQAIGGLGSLAFPIAGGALTGGAALTQYYRENPEELNKYLKYFSAENPAP